MIGDGAVVVEILQVTGHVGVAATGRVIDD